MVFKVFLDANVILDFTLQREGYNDAKQMILLAVDGKIRGYITPSVVHIVGYWLTKQYGTIKSKEILLSLLAEIHSIDIPHVVVLQALQSNITGIEDGLQYHAAVQFKLDYFISKDKKLKNQSNPTLPVLTTKEFIEKFS